MSLDPDTRAVYRRQAADYRDSRPPRFADRAAELMRAVEGPLLDAGCGTGAYLPSLGPDAIGLDGVAEMLDLADHPRRIRGDLAHLPIRRGALGGAWARNSYVHTPTEHLPMALAELHRAMAVGSPVCASFLGGADDHLVAADDLPGRLFWRQSDQTLLDLFTGAGFGDVTLDNDRPRFVHAIRARTLPDTVGPDMAMLVCGLNPSLHAADAGVGFVTPSNRFWSAAIAAGLVDRPRDPWDALGTHGIGMTDLVKRASRRADELTRAEYRDGLARIERLCHRLQPGVVCFVGLAGWRAAVEPKAVAGPQPRQLGGRPVYVMPSTSGLNARSSMDEHVGHLGAALGLSGS